jgi:KUP system potassium uptake protein
MDPSTWRPVRRRGDRATVDAASGDAGGAEREHRHHLALLSVGALGVVYGDIGTSPLYAFRETVRATGGGATDPAAILGLLSLMIWSLLVVVSGKYLGLVLRADNHGEGGVLALTALVLPRHHDAPRRRRALIVLGLFGTALLYGDGVITPAISVLAAVEGLEVAASGLSPAVLPAAIGILIGLFAVQHVGTARIGAVFGPVMTLWFVTLAALGIRQLIHAPQVLAALSPMHAITFARERPGVAFLALGGIFLVVTGAEALYADLGHFGRRPIQLGWFTVVLPALSLNYLGQGALLLREPQAIDSPFFLMGPSWATWPLVALATAATVIASQALITGAYSLTMQAVQLGYLPRVRIDHTSASEFGQVYLPIVNAALMVGCVLLVLTFRSSGGLAAAYGVAVTSTMAVTTLLVAVVAHERWRWPRWLVVTLAVVLLTVDLAFLTANLLKIPAGGWLPLAIGAVMLTVMTTWHRGRDEVARARRLGTRSIERFLAEAHERPLTRLSGTAVYLGADLGRTPSALEADLTTHRALHERLYVVTVQITDRAQVPEADRAVVHDLGDGVVQVLLRFGFMQRPDVPAALRPHLPDGTTAEELVYFVGHETIVAGGDSRLPRWRERLFAVLHRNAATPVRYFDLPRDRIVQIGTVISI